MKKYWMLFALFFASATAASLAYESDLVDVTRDGNQIAEPLLADYSVGSRTPGFSPITDIEYR